MPDPSILEYGAFGCVCLMCVSLVWWIVQRANHDSGEIKTLIVALFAESDCLKQMLLTHDYTTSNVDPDAAAACQEASQKYTRCLAMLEKRSAELSNLIAKLDRKR